MQALFEPAVGATLEMSDLVRQSGFAVYRNTVMKGCIDALQANYPSVTRLVGEEWMRAAAAIYARMYQTEDPRMLHYGEQFADFLAQFEPAAELPYLPDVARLDRFWSESYTAHDEEPLDIATLSDLAPEVLAGTVLHPHGSARWAWFATGPIYTIWEKNRELFEDDSEIEWRGEGALLVRPRETVEWIALDASGCAFLDACRNGWSLSKAATAALALQESVDLARLLAKLLQAGAFSRASVVGTTSEARISGA